MPRGVDGDGGAAVPRADVLADVAAEDVVADCGSLGGGHLAFEFDVQIGDAEAGVELPFRVLVAGGHDGLCGAGINAFGARATIIFGKRVVVNKWKVNNDGCNKKE